VFTKVEPIYEELPGWKEDISELKTFEGLPQNAKDYVRYIEKKAALKINMISVGSRRNQTINLLKSAKAPV